MFNIDKITLDISFNWYLLFVFVIIGIIWTLFYYKLTIPQLSNSKKAVVIALRILVLILLVSMIFEPNLILTSKIDKKSKHLVFIDNSNSILAGEQNSNAAIVLELIKQLSVSSINTNVELNTFGSKIQPVEKEKFRPTFDEHSTNFSSLFEYSKEIRDNALSLTIISDGIITEGSQAINSAEKIGIPIFTVGLGDTSIKKDIVLTSVLQNELIYENTPTQISVSFENRGFINKNVDIQLFEDNILIDQKKYFINYDGIHNLLFDYSPKKSGEKKIRLNIRPLDEESNLSNNSKSFFIKVLNNKIKVTLVAGSPSNDVSFIKNTLENDSNIVFSSVIQLGTNKYLNNTQLQKSINEADILFLVNFPTLETSSELINLVLQKISTKSTPYFILISPIVDPNKLKQIQSELPLSVNKVSSGIIEGQPLIINDESRNPILQNNLKNFIQSWNNLPPISLPNWEISAKPEAKKLSKVKANNIEMNIPLITTRTFGKKRSVSVLGGDIWKWKLIRAPSGINLFDSFIMNSLKWLNANEEAKQVRIKTTKKFYSSGEKIEIIGEVFDESFNFINDATVEVAVKSKNQKIDVGLSPVGNGLYEGIIESLPPGDYSFNGAASIENKKIGDDNGRFSVGEIDVESINTIADFKYLSLLSESTKGQFFSIEDVRGLIRKLEVISTNNNEYKYSKSEYRLWADYRTLLIIILLLGIEWFIRKREGML